MLDGLGVEIPPILADNSKMGTVADRACADLFIACADRAPFDLQN
jgi:hypothetical protein